MCGLFAGVGKLSGNRIIALGSMNEDRGTDSVGLAYMDNGKVTIAKIAERPSVGLNLALRKQVTEAALSGVFIGHTRQATQGDVTSKNAHPFLVDDVAFAHNGIITNDIDFGVYEVDSESLIHGIKARDFSKYEGCIALIWIEGGVLKAYRHGNPLYRGRFNGTTYLASEDDYLKAIGCTHVKELSEGMIYTFTTPTQVTTERVKKNKLYSYVAKTYSPATGGLGYDYDYAGREGTDYVANGKAYNSLEAYMEAKDKLKAGSQTYLIDKDGREIAVREDFRTPSDIAKEDRYCDWCDMCGKKAELTEGYCLECITWLDDNGGTDKDVPPTWLRSGC